MVERKVEHINGGTAREFSAIRGQGKGGKGPTTRTHEDKAAIVSILNKKDNSNPGA